MRRTLASLILASASLSLLLVACGDDDASVGPPDLGPPDLGEPDMDLPPSKLFAACERDSQCPGEGARCRRPADGWPNGYCTVPCVPPDVGPCQDEDGYFNFCLTDGAGESWCERRCLNGVDCARNGYTCVGAYPFGSEFQGACVGICLGDDDCSRSEVCDVESGRCVAELPTTGGPIGANCAADAECRSNNCITELGPDGSPSGFLGGGCVSLCILPAGYNGNTLYAGTTLPQGNCPSNAVCWINGSLAEGDPGLCLEECATNADCNSGLECAREFPLSSGDVARFDNGVCLPIDCTRDDCPAGSTCRVTTAGGRRSGSCVSS